MSSTQRTRRPVATARSRHGCWDPSTPQGAVLVRVVSSLGTVTVVGTVTFVFGHLHLVWR